MNSIKTEADITDVIRNDEWMMKVLQAAEDLGLKDWWIGAGFLRNKIWNYIEGKDNKHTSDVDLVYFNSDNTTAEADNKYDKHMNKKYPFAEWEIRNQARMHYVNGFKPFASTADGISHWVETATCVAVKLDKDELKYLFCYGTDDLYNLVARPTPYFKKSPLLSRFDERVSKKEWQKKWPNLRINKDESR